MEELPSDDIVPSSPKLRKSLNAKHALQVANQPGLPPRTVAARSGHTAKQSVGRSAPRGLSDSARRDHGMSLLSSSKRTSLPGSGSQMITSCVLVFSNGETGSDAEAGTAASAKHRCEGRLHFAGLKGLPEQRGATEFERYDRGIARSRKEDERNLAGRKDPAHRKTQSGAKPDIEQRAIERPLARQFTRLGDRGHRPDGLQAAFTDEVADGFGEEVFVFGDEYPAPVPRLAVAQHGFSDPDFVRRRYGPNLTALRSDTSVDRLDVFTDLDRILDSI